MQLTRFIVVLLAAVSSLAVSVDGFAPALLRLPKISSHSPYDNKLQNLYNRNVALQRGRRAARGVQAASMESMEIPSTTELGKTLNRLQSSFVKALMLAYIASMCIALPLTLFPVFLLYKANFITRIQKEKMSLWVSQFCSRWLMRLFPFASKRVIVNSDDEQLLNPQPVIWACNHISALDLFFILGLDKKMRGKNRRPIKVLYWQGLEANPITKIFCKMCGFIPVAMADNGNGNQNEYDPKSFKQMLKSTKAAIGEGFDIGILPEGQPNPTPELGMQPIFPGAFTLARMSRRPIRMISLYGLNRMWNANDSIGMECVNRDMAVRVYPGERFFNNSDEFIETFDAVVGYFGAHGVDLPEQELNMWLKRES